MVADTNMKNMTNKTMMAFLILAMLSIGAGLVSAASSAWCYQETANVCSPCGGLSNGTYAFTGTWDNPEDSSMTNDGNWSTYGRDDSGTVGSSMMYVNYPKPNNATSASLWQIRVGETDIQNQTNYTIPSTCWSQPVLQFRIYSYTNLSGGLVGNLSAECYNSTDWVVIYNQTSSGIISAGNIYEEAMWWHIPNSISEMQSVTILPGGRLYSNMTLQGWCNATDDDGENLSFDVRWYRDGVLNQSINAAGTSSCYQESANVSTDCGGSSNGNYVFTDEWQSEENVIDGDWNTYTNILAVNYGYLYINYSKPPNAISATWQVKKKAAGAGGAITTTNQSIREECFTESTLQLRIYVNGAGNIKLRCLSNLGWLVVNESMGVNLYLYEEAIYWQMRTHEQNTSLNVANLSSSYTSVGDNWTLSCRAYDGTNYTAWLNSSPVIIYDIPPIVLVNSQTYFNHTMGRNQSVTFTLAINQTTDMNHTFNISDDHNGTFITAVGYNLTEWNTTAAGMTRISVTINTSDVQDTQSFNITVHRTDDGLNLTLPVTIQVSAEAAVLTLSPTTEWRIGSMYNDETESRVMIVSNTGYNATGCEFYASDTLQAELSYDSFNLSTNESKNITLSVVTPATGFYSGSIVMRCTNATSEGYQVSTADSMPYLIFVQTKPTDDGGGGGGGGSGSDISRDDVEKWIDDKLKGYIVFSWPDDLVTINSFSERYIQEVIITAREGPVYATVTFSESLCPYMSAQICDLYTNECADSATLKENEQRYVKITSDFSSKTFETLFLQEGHIEGYVQVLSNDDPGPYKYDIIIQKSFLFDKSLQWSQKYNIPQEDVVNIIKFGAISVAVLFGFVLLIFRIF